MRSVRLPNPSKRACNGLEQTRSAIVPHATQPHTIENGTPKFLNAKLSPDGNWIAYRGRDNSSLYLVHPDGSDMHLVVDNIGAVGVEWSHLGWLGVSLRKANSDESTVVLIKPDGCEAYLLPTALHGDLEGLFIP